MGKSKCSISELWDRTEGAHLAGMSLPSGIPSCSLVVSLAGCFCPGQKQEPLWALCSSQSLMHQGVSSNVLRVPISESCRDGLCFRESSSRETTAWKNPIFDSLPVTCLASAHLSGGILRYAAVFFIVGFICLFLHVNIRKPEIVIFKGSVSPCCQ